MEEDDGTVVVDMVAGERCAPERRTTTSWWLRRRRCFGHPCWTSGSAFTSKEEVFTWAKSNNRWLLHVGDIDDGWFATTQRGANLYTTPLHPSVITSPSAARHPVALSTTRHKTQTNLSILIR
uniref:Uncharacterized protein n=1 Tax=Oryza punctata TaxID=4537 RepID=A0A0E0KZK3_ORYPU